MNDEPTRATGGPIDRGKSYFIGEDGPPPFILPIGWEQYHSGSRVAEQIKAAWAANPERTQFLASKDFELHVADADGNYRQVWPPPKPPKRAWWEYRWPPFVLALLSLIAGITSIVMSLGG